MVPTDRGPDRPALLWESLRAETDPGAVLAAAYLDPDAIRRLSGHIAPAPLAWALELAARLRADIDAEYRDVAELPVHQIGVTLEAWVIDIVSALEGTGTDLYPRSMSALARGAAQRGVDFRRIVRSGRRSESRCLAGFLAVLTDRDVGPQEYADVVSTVAEVTDDGMAQFVVDYLDERSRLVDSEAMRRRGLVQELLCGDRPLSRAAMSEVAPGFDVDRVHTAFVIDHRELTADGGTAGILREVRARARDAAVVVHPETPARTVVWLTSPARPSADMLDAALRVLHRYADGVLAMGEPAPGLTGFRASYAQAADLATMAPRIAGADGVLRWSDHALTVTLGADPERSRWLVRSALGPLAEPTPKGEELRATLQAYLASGKSLVHAAQQRHVHRNTIVYRLGRIEELLGRTLQGEELALRCALHLAERFGADVLDADA